MLELAYDYDALISASRVRFLTVEEARVLERVTRDVPLGSSLFMLAREGRTGITDDERARSNVLDSVARTGRMPVGMVPPPRPQAELDDWPAEGAPPLGYSRRQL